MSHQPQDLINIFNQTFLTSHNTELIKGGSEPIYLPANAERNHHQIVFAHGYFASGLHEISHWLVAGGGAAFARRFRLLVLPRWPRSGDPT